MAKDDIHQYAKSYRRYKMFTVFTIQKSCSMNPNRREKRRAATVDEIRATAWKQIGEMGAASLSLRGIAREMGMTAPALYRYYKDRDALVTALLVDAFTAFGNALEGARDARAAEDHVGRFRAMCRGAWTRGPAQLSHFAGCDWRSTHRRKGQRGTDNSSFANNFEVPV
jgi:AcrR family transcriptional regulator